MGLHEAVYARLSGYAGLTALLGTGANFRAWPDEARQNATRPYLVFFQVGAERMPLSGVDSGVIGKRFQFNSYAESEDDARAVKDQVVAAINRLSGTYASVVIQDAYVENELDGVDDDTRLKVSIVDAVIWYEGT